MTSFSDQGTQFNYDEYSKAALAEKYTHLQRLMVKEKLKTSNLTKAYEDAIDVLRALGSKPDTYCFCLSMQQINEGHTGECRDAHAVIATYERSGLLHNR